MKWFVTDAQLAAMRAEIADAHLTVYQAVLAREWEGHGAEIQRLREDRAAELARVADPSAAYVEHLRAEVAFWRLQFAHERQRAEVSIDQCRVTHQSIGPATLPPREDRLPREFPASEEQALASLNIDGL